MRDTNHNHIPDQVEELAADVVRDLREIGRRISKQADDAKQEAVKGLHSAAETIRREAREKGVQGDALQGVDQTASNLERAAAYLKRKELEDLGRDAEKAVRRQVKRNPWPALAIALVIGVIIGIVISQKD